MLFTYVLSGDKINNFLTIRNHSFYNHSMQRNWRWKRMIFCL